jgi:hypothetical protein
MQTELTTIPDNSDFITFKVMITSFQQDTLSDGTLNTNLQTPFRNINFVLKAKENSSNVLLNNIGSHLLNDDLGIHKFSKEITVNTNLLRGKNIIITPSVNLNGPFTPTNLHFSLINVSVEGDNTFKEMDLSGNNLKPTQYTLDQNFPNPFNPSTVINYQIPQDGFVTLKIYDILGNEVATLVNEEKAIGRYEVNFSAQGGSASGGNGYNLSSGVYFYQIKTGSFTDTKKMLLVR